MRLIQFLAAGSILAAAVSAASAARDDNAARAENLIYRDGTSHNVEFRGPSGLPEPALRCGVKPASATERSAVDRRVSEFRQSPQYAALAKRRPGGTTIPVQFHIVFKTDRNGNRIGDVSDQMIADQVQVLDAAYAGRGFSFVLGGVSRTNNARWFDGCASSGVESSMKTALAVDPANNLNAYTCNPRRLLGYAYYPQS
ncbi:MAG: hypothetical protein M3R16_11070, partial [Pseudomonadota bacterium]|nr:hypothetical protein [Pseudomonadota bacterium]